MSASASTLDRSLARGIAWTGGVKWLTSLLTWGITLLIARILVPADYGLFGMAMVFIGLAQLTSDVGLAAAIIQAPRLSEPLAARLGGAALMISVGIAALSMGASGIMAYFFREDAVRWIICALSFAFILRGVQTLRRAIMTRELRFRQIAWIEGAEAAVSSVSTLVYAMLGLRYWSLVGGLLTGVTVSTALFVAHCPHRIRFPRRIEELEGTLKVGAQVFGGQVAWYAYSTADMIVVGRMLGTAALGAYTFAWVIASIAVERIAALMGRVTPAIFAAVQRDHAAVRRYVLSLTEGLGLITMPICIGIALAADLIVHVGLGEGWVAAIAPMRILALYAAVRCVTVILPQVLVYTGHARQSMRFNLIALGIVVPSFIVGATIGGTSGVALAWVVTLPALTLFTYLRYLGATFGLSLGSYFGALRPAVGATLVMAAAVLALRFALRDGTVPLAWELVATVAIGVVSYGGVVWALHRNKLAEVVRLLRSSEPPPSPPTEGAPVTSPTTTVDASPAGSAAVTVPAPQAAARRVHPRGRLLLICYHFPPDPAIGSLRWQKFARHAAERGWGVDVVMRDEGSIAAPDLDRLAELPEGTRRVGVPLRKFWFETLEDRLAKAWRRLMPRPVAPESSFSATQVGRKPSSGRDVLRAYFSVIEHLRNRRWARAAADAALELYDADKHRAVIGCGPPFSACIAGARVGAATGLPFIMDMRDPWRLAQRLPESIASPVAIALNRREEARTVARAALVVTNSAPVGDAMRKLYPTSRIVDVPNGFDDDPIPPPGARERFVIAYAGTIYLDRDPGSLFAALAMVVRDQGLTPAQIGIDLMGQVERANGRPLAAIAAEHGVGEYVRLLPTRKRADAFRFLADASMLVMLPQDADMVIPGKIYEYMRFEAWILALAPPDGAVGRLLRGSAASVVPASEPAAIAAEIARRYAQFAAGERGTPIAVDDRFSRRARAAAFFGAMDSVVRPAFRPATARAPRPVATGAPGAIAATGATAPTVATIRAARVRDHSPARSPQGT